jgi:signal peptidase II
MRALLEIRHEGWRRRIASHPLSTVRRGPQSRSVGLSAKWKLVIAWLISIIVLDQLSKMIVDRTMALHGSIPIIDGFFNLTYVRNTGAAFGMFSRSHQAFRLPFLILVSVVAIGFILTMLRRLRNQETGMITALAFILGGALGNLIDRLLHGEVIDFLDVYWSSYHWPAFNLADSFITIGVTITLYFLLKAKGEDPFAAA